MVSGCPLAVLDVEAETGSKKRSAASVVRPPPNGGAEYALNSSTVGEGGPVESKHRAEGEHHDRRGKNGIWLALGLLTALLMAIGGYELTGGLAGEGAAYTDIAMGGSRDDENATLDNVHVGLKRKAPQ